MIAIRPDHSVYRPTRLVTHAAMLSALALTLTLPNAAYSQALGVPPAPSTTATAHQEIGI